MLAVLVKVHIRLIGKANSSRKLSIEIYNRKFSTEERLPALMALE